MAKVMITKKKMQAYEDVRASGQTNMWAVNNVIALASELLTKEDCLEIMKNYSKYMEQFKIIREG